MTFHLKRLSLITLSGKETESIQTVLRCDDNRFLCLSSRHPLCKIVSRLYRMTFAVVQRETCHRQIFILTVAFLQTALSEPALRERSELPADFSCGIINVCRASANSPSGCRISPPYAATDTCTLTRPTSSITSRMRERHIFFRGRAALGKACSSQQFTRILPESTSCSRA